MATKCQMATKYQMATKCQTAPHYKCYDLTTGPCKNTNIEEHKESCHMIGVSKNPDDLLILANVACSWINTINFAIVDRSASACDTLRMNMYISFSSISNNF